MILEQVGGDDMNEDDIDDDNADIDQTIDDNKEFDEVDEFDLEELNNLNENTSFDIDTDVNNTTSMIDKIIKDDENIKTKANVIFKFPTDNNENTYDASLKKIFKKNYIYEQYIFKDDSIKKLKEKICSSIELNSIFVKSSNIKHKPYLMPSRIYLWIKNTYLDIMTYS